MLGTAEYFVELDYSFLDQSSMFKVVLKNEDSFEAFNYYRSAAWKIRGVDIPINALSEAGNMNFILIDMTGMHIEDIWWLILNNQLEQLCYRNTSISWNSLLVRISSSDLIYPPGISKFICLEIDDVLDRICKVWITRNP